jgi:ABC-type multidrug transport system fused ATPase/permease subunit
MDSFGINFASLDMILTPEGEFVFSAMSVKETTLKGGRMSRKIQAVWATIKLLYRLDARALLISVSTGIAGGVFYPLFLLIVWKAFSLIIASGGHGNDLYPQGIVLIVALFGVLAVQDLLSIVNDTATSILKAESSQQINARIMGKIPEIPYRLFEENAFQARYGLVISQASYRPGMLVDMLIHNLSSLASFLGIVAMLFALAPLLVVLLLVLIPLTAVESRFHRRTVELQVSSAPDLFRMQYLSQKSIDATWQRDIRVHNSSILEEEYKMLSHRYLSNLKRLLLHFQALRLGVAISVTAVITLAMGTVFWLISRSPSNLSEVGILLPALYLGMTRGKEFSLSWGLLVECLGYIEQVFDFLNRSFRETEPAPSLLVHTHAAFSGIER